jgi:hypothetical protein
MNRRRISFFLDPGPISVARRSPLGVRGRCCSSVSRLCWSDLICRIRSKVFVLLFLCCTE